MSGVGTEALLAAGYATFLTVAALGVDLIARHAHQRSDRYRTAGFQFHEHLDIWVCPEGERLHRVETDHDLRLARYRAEARICNSCRLKEACTDSDVGREIARPLDAWPHSEAGRFHRGLALVLVALAGLVIAVGAGLDHGPADLAALGVALALTVGVGTFLLVDFRESPARFPTAAPLTPSQQGALRPPRPP